MANTHPIWVPKAINQGGLMLSNTPERTAPNATCATTTIMPSHPIHLGTTDVRRMTKLKRGTPTRR